MEDEEFLGGELDTGFIPRFQERQTEKLLDEAARDIAVIAAAMETSKKNVTPATSTSNRRSRWVMSGRSVRHGR
jgi:hypothetical protein